MSDYTKITDFGAKDALLTGDPNKLITGQLFQDEFDAIQAATDTKANLEDIAPQVVPDPPIVTAVQSALFFHNPNVSSTFSLLEPEFSTTFDVSMPTSTVQLSVQFPISVAAGPTNLTNDFILEGVFRITNNQTASTYVYPVNTLRPFEYRHSWIGFNGNYEVDYSRVENVLWSAVLPDSIGNLVGTSMSGYTFEVLMRVDTELSVSTTISGRTILVAEEIFE